MMRAARFVTGEAAQAPVDSLPLERRAGGSYFGDDVAACELGRAGALLQAVDGVEYRVPAALAARGERGSQR
jgi:hypothetical protein